MLCADHARDGFRRFHAVLEAKHERALMQQWAQPLGGAFHIGELHREDDVVHGADLLRPLMREHLDLQIAERAFHAQALLAHRTQVRAAGEEMHLVAGRGQAGAEVAADAA